MTRSEIFDMVDDGILGVDNALNAALQYLSTDDIEDLIVTNGWDEFGDDIFEMLSEEILNPSDVLDAALQYLSTDDVTDLARLNGWDDEDEDSSYFDPDED